MMLKEMGLAQQRIFGPFRAERGLQNTVDSERRKGLTFEVFAKPIMSLQDGIRKGASASADELREHCRGELAAYKVPKRFEFVSELPRSVMGKLLRRVLR